MIQNTVAIIMYAHIYVRIGRLSFCSELLRDKTQPKHEGLSFASFFTKSKWHCFVSVERV